MDWRGRTADCAQQHFAYPISRLMLQIHQSACAAFHHPGICSCPQSKCGLLQRDQDGKLNNLLWANQQLPLNLKPQWHRWVLKISLFFIDHVPSRTKQILLNSVHEETFDRLLSLRPDDKCSNSGFICQALQIGSRLCPQCLRTHTTQANRFDFKRYVDMNNVTNSNLSYLVIRSFWGMISAVTGVIFFNILWSKQLQIN